MAKFHRILLKLSGEAFGDGVTDLDPFIIRGIARQIVTTARHRVEVAVVVGGGNFFGRTSFAQTGTDRSHMDCVDMLGAATNVLALQNFVEQTGVPARIQSTITMTQVVESYISLRAVRHPEKGHVVIFGAGVGIPYFSTNAVSVQRTLEAHCDELFIAKNGVDGVYDDDPRTSLETKRLDFVTYSDALAHEFKVVDSTVLALCRDNGLKTRVFGVSESGNVTATLLGERIGTLVTADN